MVGIQWKYIWKVEDASYSFWVAVTRIDGFIIHEVLPGLRWPGRGISGKGRERDWSSCHESPTGRDPRKESQEGDPGREQQGEIPGWRPWEEFLGRIAWLNGGLWSCVLWSRSSSPRKAPGVYLSNPFHKIQRLIESVLKTVKRTESTQTDWASALQRHSWQVRNLRKNFLTHLLTQMPLPQEALFFKFHLEFYTFSRSYSLLYTLHGLWDILLWEGKKVSITYFSANNTIAVYVSFI